MSASDVGVIDRRERSTFAGRSNFAGTAALIAQGSSALVIQTALISLGIGVMALLALIAD